MKRIITIFLIAETVVLMLITNIFALSAPFAQNGVWEKTENGCRGTNKSSGDCFYMSDTYLSAETSFVFSCDFTFDGNAVGAVIAADKNNPSADWYCVNYDPPSGIARLFRVKNGALVISCPVSLNAESLGKSVHNFRIVGIKGSVISFYADGLLAGSISCSDFSGGYAGVMTCLADGEFTNISYNEISAPAIQSVTFENIEFTPSYSPSSTEFLAFVPYQTSSFKLNAVFDEAITLKAGNKAVKSGEPSEIKLGVGYNQISLEMSYDLYGEKISSVQYLIVQRAQSDEYLYKEDYRPYYHYSSAAEWINDPNGLCYDAATGLYHMFYQTRPRTSVASPNTSWYHAVSKDLLHWEQQSPALVPDSLGLCWSGSAGIDRYNTSGLFPESSAPESRIVLAFSSVYGDTFYGNEKISLAYTPDAGKTWITYDKNPIIRNGENHIQQYNDGFRDPKLLWFEDSSYKNGGIWLMLVGGGQGRIFSSENLLDWKFESAMTDRDGSILSGECPDFFKMKIEGTNEEKWVYMRGYLDLNANPQVFQTRPVIGDLHKDSNGVFVFEVEQDTKQVMYEGNTMYATQSFAESADGRRIQISWCREWLEVSGAKISPLKAKNWNGLMSLPLELKLYRTSDGYVFTSYPIEETKNLRDKTVYSAADVKEFTAEGKFFEIDAELKLSQTDSVFTLREGKSGKIKVTVSDYDSTANTAKVTANGKGSGKYGGLEEYVIAKTDGNKLRLRIYVDANTVEVYCGSGQNAVVILAYPEPDNTGISYSGTELSRVDIYEMKSFLPEKTDTEPTTDTTEAVTQPQTDKPDTDTEPVQPIKKSGTTTALIIAGAAIAAVAVSLTAIFIISKKKK